MDLLNPLNPLSPLNPISPLNPNSLLNSEPSEPRQACIPDATNNFCQMTDVELVFTWLLILAMVGFLLWLFKVAMDS